MVKVNTLSLIGHVSQKGDTNNIQNPICHAIHMLIPSKTLQMFTIPKRRCNSLMRLYSNSFIQKIFLLFQKKLRIGLGLGYTTMIIFAGNALAFWFGMTLRYHDHLNPATGRPWEPGNILAIFFCVPRRMGTVRLGRWERFGLTIEIDMGIGILDIFGYMRILITDAQIKHIIYIYIYLSIFIDTNMYIHI